MRSSCRTGPADGEKYCVHTNLVRHKTAFPINLVSHHVKWALTCYPPCPQLLTFLLFGPLLPSVGVDGDGLSLPKGIFRHSPSSGLRRFRRLGEV